MGLEEGVTEEVLDDVENDTGRVGGIGKSRIDWGRGLEDEESPPEDPWISSKLIVAAVDVGIDDTGATEPEFVELGKKWNWDCEIEFKVLGGNGSRMIDVFGIGIWGNIWMFSGFVGVFDELELGVVFRLSWLCKYCSRRFFPGDFGSNAARPMGVAVGVPVPNPEYINGGVNGSGVSWNIRAKPFSTSDR
jgi:hypothetical protein